MINQPSIMDDAIIVHTGLKDKLTVIGAFIGDTPLRKLACDEADLFVKLEYNNYSGSIKDRAVFNILSHAIDDGLIDEDTTIVESSSGNFAISLASMCRVIGIKSTVVIDPNINYDYEQVLRVLATEVIKVTERDHTGGFLLTRIETIQRLRTSIPNVFWTNQYENPNNYTAYYYGLGVEICKAFDELDYVFIGVSTCGTITGISMRIKEKFPNVTVVAVDIEGSVIFGEQPKKRHISGLGASKVPLILSNAMIDQVINVSELNIVKGARMLLEEQAIFGGASAGAMYYAARTFFQNKTFSKKPKALFLCPDKGTAYLDNIYNEQWVKENLSPDGLINF
jgi:N-(2-amino-2-carboxyethyl)-L-glutamate synthase